AGVLVAKHGTVAASSLSGSADVLQALGVKIDVQPDQAEDVFQTVGMVFLFAPLYHPAYKPVTIVRKELKIRTVFNFLGPFVSPASVTRQLIGVSNLAIAEKLAEVAKRLNYQHLLIVASEDGMDEISLSVNTHVFEIKNNTITKSIIQSSDFGFTKITEKEMKGGNAKENAKIMREILSGKKGAKRDIVLFN